MASGDLRDAPAQWPVAFGLPATAIIQLASQDQRVPWLVSLASLPTP